MPVERADAGGAGRAAAAGLSGTAGAIRGGATAPFSRPSGLTDALAAEYGWPRAAIDALSLPEALGLLASATARRRQELADLALAVYAGAAGALGGAEGYRSLLRWTRAQRGEEAGEDGVVWL
ncbi:MAG TPA: hypothetical protein PLZ36_01915 [Armatimonadota bacterium]|nr:hypothetical protein [Armatimonadota bacterium]